MKRPSSPSVCRRTRSWRTIGSVAVPLPLARSTRNLRHAAEHAAAAAAGAAGAARHEVAGAPVEVTGRPCPATPRPLPPDPPPVPRPARSFMSVVLATAQPLLRSPMMAASDTRASVRKTSLNSAWPVISRSGRTSTPGWCMSIANQVMPWCLGSSGVGAGDQHAEVGDLAARRPHLLTVDDPLVAVLDRAGREPGEIGSGTGLAEQLAPRLRARDDVADVQVDLLLRAVRRDRRRREQQPETGRRARARRSRRSRVCTRTASLRDRPRPYALVGSDGADHPAHPEPLPPLARRSDPGPSCPRATLAARRSARRRPARHGQQGDDQHQGLCRRPHRAGPRLALDAVANVVIARSEATKQSRAATSGLLRRAVRVSQ